MGVTGKNSNFAIIRQKLLKVPAIMYNISINFQTK